MRPASECRRKTERVIAPRNVVVHRLGNADYGNAGLRKMRGVTQPGTIAQDDQRIQSQFADDPLDMRR